MYWLLPVKIRPFGGRGKRRATGRGPNRRLSAGTIAAIMRRVEESPMSRIVFRNAMVLDPAKGDLAGERNVLVEDGTIAAVSKEALEHEDARAVDLEGRTLMPGLCDAHVHVTAVTPDFAALRHWSPFYVAARAADILEGMLMRGFTTVRDAGGADFGLAAEQDAARRSRRPAAMATCAGRASIPWANVSAAPGWAMSATA
jgi:cytosine/adenosine deaminase-related metal-dependent hydrolase